MARQGGPNPGKPGLLQSLGNLAGAIGFAMKDGGGAFVSAVGSLLKGSGKVAGRTAGGAGGIVSGVVNKTANVIRGHPKISFVLGVYAGFKGIQHVMRRHQEKKEAAMQAEAPPLPVADVSEPYGFSAREPMAQEQPPMPQAGVDGPTLQEQQAFMREMQQMQRQDQPPAQPQGAWSEQVLNARRQLAQQQGGALTK